MATRRYDFRGNKESVSALRFSPPAGVQASPTDHAGFTIRDGECEFFAPPPSEIGDIRSRWSTLSPTTRMMPSSLRMFLIVAGGLGLAVLGAAVGIFLDAAPLTALGALGGLVFGSGFVWLKTRGLHSCTYVGVDGVAQFWCVGSPDNIVRSDTFLFENAVELRTRQIRKYLKSSIEFTIADAGVYKGTEYVFEWFDADGTRVFSLEGKYYSETGQPIASSPFWFARSAEASWTDFLVAHIDEIRSPDGTIDFLLTNGDSLSVGIGFLVARLRGQSATLAPSDIASIHFDKGELVIEERGAKIGFFSSQGYHRFMTSELGNSLFFLTVVNKDFLRDS
jgi:hypothetical protein